MPQGFLSSHGLVRFALLPTSINSRVHGCALPVLQCRYTNTLKFFGAFPPGHTAVTLVFFWIMHTRETPKILSFWTLWKRFSPFWLATRVRGPSDVCNTKLATGRQNDQSNTIDLDRIKWLWGSGTLVGPLAGVCEGTTEDSGQRAVRCSTGD